QRFQTASRWSVMLGVMCASRLRRPVETHTENDRAFIGSPHPYITFDSLFGGPGEILVSMSAPHNGSVGLERKPNLLGVRSLRDRATGSVCNEKCNRGNRLVV